MDTQHIKNILEAALLCAQEPMQVAQLSKLFDDELEASLIVQLLHDMQGDWGAKAVELVELNVGWRFQTKPQFKSYLDKLNPEKPQKYSRSVLETLAIIAYKQPVTRGDIETIRGVTVSSEIIKKLEDRQWIEVIGHRDAPGRPALFATTSHFLEDLSLKTLSDLPPLVSTEQFGDLMSASQTPIEFDSTDDAQQVT